MTENPLLSSVLLIEDDSGHALLVQRALKGLVEKVQHVETLQQADAALKGASFDAIITDLHLPDGKDIEVIDSLRKNASETPLLVLTSSTSLTSAVEAMKRGAKDFIVKNFGNDFRDMLSLSLRRISGALLLERERIRLQREMAILRLAIENSNDGFALVSSDGVISYSNTSFHSYVGKWGGSPNHLKNLFSDKVQRKESFYDFIQEKISTLPEMGVWSTEIMLLDDKNAAWELSLSMLPASTRPGDTVQRSGVLWIRDRSEDKRREKFQREILSTTTHDLKGPLGAIILSAELIQTSKADMERITNLALRIGSSAQGAVNLIDEFLSARRIQEGTFILKPTEQDAALIIEESIVNFQTMASAKSILLSTDIVSAPLNICVDRLALVRVLGNLLSNAIKFTPKGGAVSLRAIMRGEDLTISVQDTGSGMEPSEVNRIFERFSRLSKHSEVAGSGLGLFVVKSLVTAHGGRIDVTSSVGKGTTFEVTFPRKPPMNEKGELISLDFA